MSKRDVSGRILSVNVIKGEHCAVVAIGDAEHEIVWEGMPPTPGDVFLFAPRLPWRAIKKIGSAQPGSWGPNCDALRWRRRGSQGVSRMNLLWQRHKIRSAVRDYMDSEEFIEMDVPLLVHGTTPDAYINSFSVGDRYLSTSTEYQIKRLEVGGFDRTYTLTQNFRAADGEGSTHNPEFTMLEWARVGQPLSTIEEDCEQLAWRAHQALGGKQTLTYQGNCVFFEPPWQRLSVVEAIHKVTGISMPNFEIASLVKALVAVDIEVKMIWRDDRAFLFSLLMEHISQFLGFDRPTFLCDWPSFQTSSAQEKSGFLFAERCEAFICGLELSNGFPSLTDYERQRATFQLQQERRVLEGNHDVKLDESYLKALEVGLPSGAGMALGFDRLVMLLTDQPEIRSVLSFAWDEV